MFVAVLSLCILLCGSLSGLIMPMTKPDGSADLSSLLNHVTLLEQTVTSLQKTTGELQTDLQVSKAQSAAQISSLTKEVDSLKAELKLSFNDIAALKTEMNDMKKGTELQTTKALAQTTSQQVKRLELELNSTSSSVLLTQSNLLLTRTEVTTLRNDLSAVRNQSLENKQSLTKVSQDLKLVLAGVHTTTNTSLATLTSDLAVVKKQSEDNKKLVASLVSKTRNVAFQVSSPSSGTHPQAITTLTFKNIQYNAGSAFDTTTGNFSAPESGTYMFWTKLEMVDSNTNMNMNIMKSGRVYMAGGYVATDSNIYVADGSAVVVCHLNKGEEVWVEVSSTQNFYNGNMSSYFGGVMLSVD